MSENQKDPQYKLRWSEDLRDKVMQSAKENNRSINQEIIAKLEDSFSRSYTENVDFAKGYLDSFLRIKATAYYISMNEVKEMYKKDPSPELLYEQTKYELLFREMMRLAEYEEELRNKKMEHQVSDEEFEKMAKQAFENYRQNKKNDK